MLSAFSPKPTDGVHLCLRPPAIRLLQDEGRAQSLERRPRGHPRSHRYRFAFHYCMFARHLLHPAPCLQRHYLQPAASDGLLAAGPDGDAQDLLCDGRAVCWAAVRVPGCGWRLEGVGGWAGAVAVCLG